MAIQAFCVCQGHAEQKEDRQDRHVSYSCDVRNMTIAPNFLEKICCPTSGEIFTGPLKLGYNTVYTLHLGCKLTVSTVLHVCIHAVL